MKMGKCGAAASLLILAMAAPVAAFAQQQPAAPAGTKEKSVLTSDREKIGYAIGVDVASSFEPLAADVDVAAMRRAVENIFAGGQPLLSREEAQATDQAVRTLMMVRSGQQVPGMAPGSQPPQVDREKVGLMLGSYAMGPALAPIKDDIDLDSTFQAIQTIFTKGTPLLDREQAQAMLQAFSTAKQAALVGKNREEGNAFLAKNKTQPGVVTTASGLQYQVLRAGSGERPLPSNRVRVNYEGKLLDGTVFDSSYQRGEPADFGLTQVIKGWTEGLSLMPVGSKYRFWIPSDLAYGTNGTPNGPIGPEATLTFDVELLGILP